MRFIESKVQQKQMYKLCLYSAWRMGCGRWRQQQSPELLLDHVPVGGRASSMHCAEQAAIAQPAIGLCSIRAWGQGKGRYVQQRLNRCPLVHREVGCFFYTILGWAVPGRDRTTMNMGQEPAPQEKWNHPLLITTVDLALQVDVPLVYISPEQWTQAFAPSKGKAQQALEVLQPQKPNAWPWEICCPKMNLRCWNISAVIQFYSIYAKPYEAAYTSHVSVRAGWLLCFPLFNHALESNQLLVLQHIFLFP